MEAAHSGQVIAGSQSLLKVARIGDVVGCDDVAVQRDGDFFGNPQEAPTVVFVGKAFPMILGEGVGERRVPVMARVRTCHGVFEIPLVQGGLHIARLVDLEHVDLGHVVHGAVLPCGLKPERGERAAAEGDNCVDFKVTVAEAHAVKGGQGFVRGIMAVLAVGSHDRLAVLQCEVAGIGGGNHAVFRPHSVIELPCFAVDSVAVEFIVPRQAHFAAVERAFNGLGNTVAVHVCCCLRLFDAVGNFAVQVVVERARLVLIETNPRDAVINGVFGVFIRFPVLVAEAALGVNPVVEVDEQRVPEAGHSGQGIFAVGLSQSLAEITFVGDVKGSVELTVHGEVHLGFGPAEAVEVIIGGEGRPVGIGIDLDLRVVPAVVTASAAFVHFPLVQGALHLVLGVDLKHVHFGHHALVGAVLFGGLKPEGGECAGGRGHFCVDFEVTVAEAHAVHRGQRAVGGKDVAALPDPHGRVAVRNLKVLLACGGGDLAVAVHPVGQRPVGAVQRAAVEFVKPDQLHFLARLDVLHRQRDGTLAVERDRRAAKALGGNCPYRLGKGKHRAAAQGHKTARRLYAILGALHCFVKGKTDVAAYAEGDRHVRACYVVDVSLQRGCNGQHLFGGIGNFQRVERKTEEARKRVIVKLGVNRADGVVGDIGGKDSAEEVGNGVGKRGVGFCGDDNFVLVERDREVAILVQCGNRRFRSGAVGVADQNFAVVLRDVAGYKVDVGAARAVKCVDDLHCRSLFAVGCLGGVNHGVVGDVGKNRSAQGRFGYGRLSGVGRRVVGVGDGAGAEREGAERKQQGEEFSGFLHVHLHPIPFCSVPSVDCICGRRALSIARIAAVIKCKK